MKASELIKKIVEEKTAHLFRACGEHVKGEPWNYEARYIENEDYVYEEGEGDQLKVEDGWILLDLFTASAMATVYDALNEDSKAKFDCLHIISLVDFTWKHVK